MEITRKMSERAYELAADAFRGRITKAKAIRTLEAETGISEGSARSLVYDFPHLIRGEEYNRTMNLYTTQRFLERIRQDFDERSYRNALEAVTKNLDYLDSRGKGEHPSLRNLIARLKSELAVPHEAPQASDLNEPPTRIVTKRSRIIRDTVLANEVKALHDYKCQICGHSIELSNGSRYAEGHHIKPLGMPHNGPDIPENILIVCPNHHAECDFGAICLDIRKLRILASHTVGEQFIDYHNSHIFRHVGMIGAEQIRPADSSFPSPGTPGEVG